MSAEKLAHANSVTMKNKYPEGISWDLTVGEDDLVKLFDESVARFAGRPCIDFYGRKLNYLQVGNLVDDVAAGLQEQGIGPGSTVGLCMVNTPYYPIMMFAALKAGARVVNYNPTYSEDKLEHLVKDSGTDVMVTLDLEKAGNDPYYAKLKKLVDDGHLKKIIVCPFAKMMPLSQKIAMKYPGLLFTGARILGTPPLSYFFGDLAKKIEKTAKKIPAFVTPGDEAIKFKTLQRSNWHFMPPKINRDEIAIIQYTGGTTGMPKGAMLTHFNLAANAAQVDAFFAKGPGKPDVDTLLTPGQERIMGALPNFHVFGLQIAMITAMKLGAEILMVADPRDIKQLGKTIAKEKPTLMPGVPKLFQALTESPDIKGESLRSIKLAISGGAAMPANVRDRFKEMSDKTILQGYGLSETSPVATAEPLYGKRKEGSIGLVLPGTEVRIADMNDPTKTMKIGEMGEVAIRGPQIMKGYFNDAAESAKVITEDGWFLSGDLGHMDEDMFIYLSGGRKKRMSIINGFNVYHTQIEAAAEQHPALLECCAVKILDDRSGEAVKIFVRYRDDAKDKPSEKELRAFLAKHLEPIAVPKEIEIADKPLPTTDIGKPDYKVLEQAELEKYQGRKQGGAGPKPSPQ